MSDEPKRTAVITGGRDYEATMSEFAEMLRVARERDIEEFIAGGARGVDSDAAEYLRAHGCSVREMPADWNLHGKAAGPIRNREMLSQRGVRLCIAFKGGRGTWNCIQTAKRLGVDVHVIGEGRW